MSITDFGALRKKHAGKDGSKELGLQGIKYIQQEDGGRWLCVGFDTDKEGTEEEEKMKPSTRRFCGLESLQTYHKNAIQIAFQMRSKSKKAKY